MSGSVWDGELDEVGQFDSPRPPPDKALLADLLKRGLVSDPRDDLVEDRLREDGRRGLVEDWLANLDVACRRRQGAGKRRESGCGNEPDAIARIAHGFLQ